MTPEIYREIPDYPLYEVSNYGNVRSWKNNKWGKADYPKQLSKYLGNNGYYTVVLLNDRHEKKKTVHRLVARAFIGKPGEKIQVRHMDGSRTNNRLENLKYGTQKDNSQDSVEHGTSTKGTRNARAKLDDSKALEIRNLKGLMFQKAIADQYNVSVSTVSQIHNDKIWTHI